MGRGLGLFLLLKVVHYDVKGRSGQILGFSVHSFLRKLACAVVNMQFAPGIGIAPTLQIAHYGICLTRNSQVHGLLAIIYYAIVHPIIESEQIKCCMFARMRLIIFIFILVSYDKNFITRIKSYRHVTLHTKKATHKEGY